MTDNAVSESLESLRQHGPHDSGLDHSATAKDDMLRLRLRELEEENVMLVGKATAASQRFVDYENNIRVLQLQLKEQQERNTLRHQAHPEPRPAPPERPGLSRLGSFMRKSSAPPSPASGPSAREQELEAALAKEQSARKEAERKTKEVTAEIEDLSTSLFQQANDMVASERKENAVLKDRIEELESVRGSMEAGEEREVERLKQKIRILEEREAERQKRLEKLESAQRRIERVRAMLAPHG